MIPPDGTAPAINALSPFTTSTSNAEYQVNAAARFRLPVMRFPLVLGSLLSATLLQTPAQHPNHRQRLAEPLGVSSKMTPLVFSEIMYHPAARTDGRNLEFIELFNTNPWPEDLTNWRISDDVDFAFPAGTTIPSRGYLVIAAVPADVQATYGITGVLGPFSGSLSNEGGTLRLRRANDAIVLQATWNDGPDWPASADGTGHSLILERPSYGEGNPLAWAASIQIGGTPGAPDAPPSSPLQYVRINEIVAHSTTGEDFIELFNSSPAEVNIGGCWLSDDEDLLGRFEIPSGTLLPPRGIIRFSQTALGFGLSATGETLYFSNPARTSVLEAVRFRGQLPDTALGRFPDGEGPLRRLVSATPDATNSAPARGPVVINEIYFHPITNDSEEEWLELHNLTATPVSMAGWRLSDGVSYNFPAGATIAANGFLVVARNPARLLANHPTLLPAQVLGPFTGSLADGGEEVVLASPVTIATANGTLTHHAAVDEVAYVDKSRWSQWADGGGSSLELSDARDSATPLWLDSDETAKAPWTSVEITGVLDHVHTSTSAVANRIDAMLLGAGEALLDEAQAIPSGSTNRLVNGGFESGIGSWLVQGTHNKSVIHNGGFAGVRSLRIAATGRGDIAPNRVCSFLTSTIPANSTATLRANVRWLRGSDEFLLRLMGGGLEAYAKLAVPKNLGTPGAVNSRAVANAAPAVTDVIHSPVLPAANTAITVSARVTDPSGVSSVTLRYRIDPSSTLSNIAMNDSGTGGDLLAGDGIHTGTIPGQAAARLVAFTVSASDSAAASAVFPPAGECLVRVGDTLPTGAFGAYSMWISSAALAAWNVRIPKSNEKFPLTFLHNTSRVFYASGVHLAQNFENSNHQNPFGTTLNGYQIDLPPGEPLFGENDVTLDWPVRDATNQREQLMHWMLDQMKLPTQHRRDVHLMVNGARRFNSSIHIYHDAHQPGGSYLDSNFPDDPDGRLIKTSTWLEFTETGGRLTGPINSLLPYTTTGGVLKTPRYRWCWQPRSTDGDQNDFSALFGLVNAVNTTGAGYVNAVSAQADMDQWMRNFAFADLCCFWDTFGNRNHKNAYLYKPARGRWQVLMNDMDIGLGGDNGTADPPSSSALFPTGSIDPPLLTMYATPAFLRHYWRAVSESLATFFSGTAVTNRVTQRYNGYIANGVPVTSPLVNSGPYGLSIPAWIDQRVAFLQSQLVPVTAAFTVAGPASVTTATSPLTVSGTAPVGVKTLTFNSLELPLTWTTTTAWTASVPVLPGTNPLVIAAFDSNGVQTASATRTVSFTGSAAWPALRINEWMASNSGVVTDPADGRADDWLELHNPTGFPVSLANWSLSDGAATFVIPHGYSIATGGKLIVWADDETAQNSGSGQLHINFRLSSGGETLSLRAPDGTVVDSVTFGQQVRDRSQGRIPDGSSFIDFLETHGAGQPNSSALVFPRFISGTTIVDGIVRFSVSTTPGFSYQLQSVTSLDESPWVNLDLPVPATGTSLDFQHHHGPETRRFYRVQRLP